MNGVSSAGALLGVSDTGPDTSAIVAVIGCGGKTTFIESLARECRHEKVLVTPTAKIIPMSGEDVVLQKTLPECAAHAPANGIQCLGVYNDATGKLESLPPELLAETVRQYDIVLLEADGSRGLPCKGWLPDEPVIPDYCTHTVGIVTLNALGKPADGSAVLRLPEFLRLTGMREGDLITMRALTDMVCADGGLFRHAAGKKSIFVNQIENSASAAVAEEWLDRIKRENPERFIRLAYGSARANQWKEV